MTQVSRMANVLQFQLPNLGVIAWGEGKCSSWMMTELNQLGNRNLFSS